MSDLNNAMMISAKGMKAQGTRMRIISENVANSGTISNVPGEDPYQRQVVTFKTQLDKATGADVVQVDKVIKDETEFPVKYMPGHPGADENGYVRTPNVNVLLETVDMQEAQRSYEANLNMVEMSRSMVLRTIDMLRD